MSGPSNPVPMTLEATRPVGRMGRASFVIGVVALGMLTVAIVSVGPSDWPMLPELVTIQFVVMATVCVFTALLLFIYGRSVGIRGYLVLAGTYFYVAGINVATPLMLGGNSLFSETPGLILGGPQSVIHMYSLWHWTFVFGVIAGAFLLESDRVHGRRPVLGRWTPTIVVVGVIIALAASILVVSLASAWLPTMFVGDTLTPFTRVAAILRLIIALAGTGYVALLVLKRGALINRWLLAVLLVILVESIVVLRPERNIFTYYANLALALLAMSGLLVALSWTIGWLVRMQAGQAATDSGTGVQTRTGLVAELSRVLEREGRSQRPVALLWIDLDGFQQVNDQLGHRAGDEVLIEVARRIHGRLRGPDLVGRLGGDEFGVVLCDPSGAGADLLVDEVAARILAVIREPIPVVDGTALLTASIGIALAEGPGASAADLLLQADVSMYAAKVAGGDCYERYSAEQGTRAVAQATLRHDLASALRERAFSLDFQPIIDARELTVAGAEALVRWDRGSERIPAGRFIEFAEGSGQIVGIGREVVELLGDVSAEILAAGGPDFFITMNLSVRELATSSLVDRIVTGPLGACSSRVVIEVTESFELHADALAGDNLSRLRLSGFAIAVDDFGSGYSNLSQLTQLRPRIIKTDRSLVEAATAGTREGVALLAAAKAIADALGCDVVAEGVETALDDAVARALGLRYLQGYLYARPMRPEALIEQLRVASPVTARTEDDEDPALAIARFTREGRLLHGSTLFRRISGAADGAYLTDLVTEGQRAQMERLLDGRDAPTEKRHVNFVSGERLPVSLLVTWAWDIDELVLVGEPPVEDAESLQDMLVKLNSRVADLARDSAKRTAELTQALDEAKDFGRHTGDLKGGGGPVAPEETLEHFLAENQAAVIAGTRERMRDDVTMEDIARQRNLSEDDLVNQVLGFWLQAISTDIALGSRAAMSQNIEWLARMQRGHGLPFSEGLVMHTFECISAEIDELLVSGESRREFTNYRADAEALIGETFPIAGGSS